jgi:hypothetical protein
MAVDDADKRLIAAAPALLEALRAVVTNPHGCRCCDAGGVLRRPDLAHDPGCPYLLARAAVEVATA